MSTQTSTPVLTDAAAALIHKDVLSFKADRKRYAEYVAEMHVTTETVAAHVALFRDAYRAALPKAGGDEVKAYATKVRNGLNYQVGKQSPEQSDVTNLLTADGLAGFADHTAEEMLLILMAEVERRAVNKK